MLIYIDLNPEINIFLNRLQITHTFGTNGIPSSMLTLLSNELCRPLYIIFNSSLLIDNLFKKIHSRKYNQKYKV